MFMPDEYRTPKHLLGIVRKLNKHVCCYSGPSATFDGPPSFCDCKYGAEKIPANPIGEQTGCPELRIVSILLEKISQGELDLILDR